MRAHLARLGGVIVHPRATLERVLSGDEGNLWEILPWLIVVSAAAGPVRAGNAALIARIDLFDGVRAFFILFQERIVVPLLGVVAAASLLHLLDRGLRGGEARITFDAALDACALALVPHLIATALGVALASLDVEVWFLPHHPLAGRGLYFAGLFFASYGWSLALFALMAVDVVRRARRA